jgi:hypothetical protein
MYSLSFFSQLKIEEEKRLKKYFSPSILLRGQSILEAGEKN